MTSLAGAPSHFKYHVAPPIPIRWVLARGCYPTLSSAIPGDLAVIRNQQKRQKTTLHSGFQCPLNMQVSVGLVSNRPFHVKR